MACAPASPASGRGRGSGEAAGSRCAAAGAGEQHGRDDAAVVAGPRRRHRRLRTGSGWLAMAAPGHRRAQFLRRVRGGRAGVREFGVDDVETAARRRRGNGRARKARWRNRGTEAGAVAGDVTAGRRAFNRNCRACHQVETGAGSALGPNLAGILGRAARADGAFEYSPAFAAAAERGVVWDASTLERYLAAPTAMIPGSKMPLAVTDAAQRRDLVAYLATLSP